MFALLLFLVAMGTGRAMTNDLPPPEEDPDLSDAYCVLTDERVRISVLMDDAVYQWLTAFVEHGSNIFMPTIDDAIETGIRVMMEPDNPKAVNFDLFKQMIEYTRAAQTEALKVLK